MVRSEMKIFLDRVRKLRQEELSTTKLKKLDEIERCIILAIETDMKDVSLSYMATAQLLLDNFVPTRLFG